MHPQTAPPLRRIENLNQDMGLIRPTEDGQFYALDGRVRFLWMISRFITWIILFGILFTVLSMGYLSGAQWSRILLYVFVGLLLPASLHLAWPMISYRYWGVTLRHEDVLVRWGVLWKRMVAIPFNRIQHVDSHSGPIERSFGLANLVIHTAGSHLGAISVPGLPIDQAEALRDYLSKVGHSHANI